MNTQLWVELQCLIKGHFGGGPCSCVPLGCANFPNERFQSSGLALG